MGTSLLLARFHRDRTFCEGFWEREKQCQQAGLPMSSNELQYNPAMHGMPTCELVALIF